MALATPVTIDQVVQVRYVVLILKLFQNLSAGLWLLLPPGNFGLIMLPNNKLVSKMYLSGN